MNKHVVTGAKIIGYLLVAATGIAESTELSGKVSESSKKVVNFVADKIIGNKTTNKA